jgi:hypothetical protein
LTTNDVGAGFYFDLVFGNSTLNSGGLPGDFYGNGVYECADVDALVGVIAAGTNVAMFDLTGDGLVNVVDLDEWRLVAGSTNIGPGRPYRLGDANLDGVVDGSDFGIWNAHKFTAVAEWCSGDFSADGFIDGSDFGLWNAFKFTSSDSSAVPEPVGTVAFLAAFVGMGVRRKRIAPERRKR